MVIPSQRGFLYMRGLHYEMIESIRNRVVTRWKLKHMYPLRQRKPMVVTHVL